jgi:antitoxin component of RelBE/YafQ-DinJ toxin-antitoxin module
MEVKEKYLHIRIPEAIKEKAKQVAILNGYGSLSTFVRILLLEEIKKADEAK